MFFFLFFKKNSCIFVSFQLVEKYWKAGKSKEEQYEAKDLLLMKKITQQYVKKKEKQMNKWINSAKRMDYFNVIIILFINWKIICFSLLNLLPSTIHILHKSLFYLLTNICIHMYKGSHYFVYIYMYIYMYYVHTCLWRKYLYKNCGYVNTVILIIWL
jgi:uncharacterized membrane protein (DUF106 family)